MGIRVFFNQLFERRKLDNIRGKFLADRIELTEILADPAKYLMVFRPSMREFDFQGALPPRCRCLFGYFFHAFDILRFRGEDTTQRRLLDRLDALHEAVRTTRNSHVVEVPAHVVGKATIHENLLKENAEGSVWKQLDSRYEPNRRTSNWLKRKRALSVTAFVSNLKSGTPGRGNSDLVGALEFSHQVDEGRVAPIGWISVSALPTTLPCRPCCG